VVEVADEPLVIVRRDIAEVGRIAQILGLEIQGVDLVVVGQPARAEWKIVDRLEVLRPDVDGRRCLRGAARTKRKVLAAHRALAHRDRHVIHDAVIVGVEPTMLDQHGSDLEPARRDHVADRVRFGTAREPQ